MKLLSRALLAQVLLLACCATRAPAADAAPAGQDAVLAEIRRLAPASGGELGVAARLLERGPTLAVNGDERFPMASTFKVAVAATVLAAVDEHRLTLDRMITVDPASYVDSDIIASRLVHPGVSLSVWNLLELMLTESDNTATDNMVATAGGPAAVTAWLRSHGIAGQRVDRDTAGLLRDFFHLPAGPFQAALAAGLKAHPEIGDLDTKPNPSFDDDARDTSTPLAMLDLLTRIFRGEALSKSSTSVIVDIMGRCRTGTARLRGLLPEGTAVAHKTGTIGGTVNDVGVITLPDGRHVVIAVFIKKSTLPIEARERVIAEVARTLRDYYLAQGNGS